MQTALAEGVLDGTSVCVAFEDEGLLGGRLGGLGAAVQDWGAGPGASEADGEAAIEAAGALGAVDVLVADAGSRFRALGTGVGPVDRLRAAIDEAFVVVRAVAASAWIEPAIAGGKVLVIAPAPEDGEHAVACAAALENMVRTLSVEWARFGVRLVAIAPRAGAESVHVADLVGFLASPGGDYYSGCVLRPGA
jgi:NAD(P)-dependent dehydrogenase (short-subunit alcohol dehydrogenase family)